MELADSYEELDFKDLQIKKRDSKSGQGTRKHNVGVRPLGGHFGPSGNVSPYEQAAAL